MQVSRSGPKCLLRCTQHQQTFLDDIHVVLGLLLRETVDAPSLEIFRLRLGGALTNLIWWVASLPMAGGLELCDIFGLL